MPGATITASVPIGTVISYVGNLDTVDQLASEGWLLCDGRSIPNAQYPGLFNTIGTGFGGTGFPDFNLPDLRGMFLRGADLSAGQDPDIGDRTAQAVNGNTGRAVDAVGSRQADQFTAHTHNVTASILFGSDETYVVSGGGSTPVGPAQCGSTGGNETRPKNVYVYYLILGDLPAPAPTA
jgi:microcystin-dependent protein